jgi:ribosomal protein L29
MSNAKNIKWIRELTDEDLYLKMEEYKKKLLVLRIAKSAAQYHASAQHAESRKIIAQCKTVIKERANTSSSNEHNQGALQ